MAYSSESYGYIITYSDNASEVYTFGIPSKEDHPPTVFTNLAAAKKALAELAAKQERFIPVAYGKAYPYESTTFEQHLSNHESAPFGWCIFNDGETDFRVGINILRVLISSS
jgi:hypothetical protein